MSLGVSMRPALTLTATTRENQRDMTALAASLPLAGLPCGQWRYLLTYERF